MRIVNRRLLLGGAFCSLALSLAGASQAVAQSAGMVGGCRLCQRAHGPLAVNAAGVKRSIGKIVQSSGDTETDHFLGMALGRISGTFGVSPGFGFFDDGSAPNAFATGETLVGNGPGTVLMGMHLFGQLMAHVRDGGITVISVCAHEFGHIYQMQTGYMEKLSELDRTDRPVELHADFLAGYYLALRKAEHPELDLSAVGRVLHAVGDTAVNSPEHHGTPDERVAALTAGFKFGAEGRHEVSEAAKAGFLLVRRNS
jgi:hypothetical protein